MYTYVHSYSVHTNVRILVASPFSVVSICISHSHCECEMQMETAGNGRLDVYIHVFMHTYKRTYSFVLATTPTLYC